MNSNTKRLGRLPPLTELIKTDPATELKLEHPNYELSATAHFAGLVAVGGDFSSQRLLQAYENGIFPWPHGDQIDLWFSPVWRGVIDFSELHVPRSLGKALRQSRLRFTRDLAFEDVMQGCAQARRQDQAGSWIVPELKDGYLELHKKGFAHSVEAWEGDTLVAGIYGVNAKGNFSAESMFGLKTNSSKLCLLKLIEWLQESGFSFLDVQMVTPVTQSLGAKYISRREYLNRLLALQKKYPRLL